MEGRRIFGYIVFFCFSILVIWTHAVSAEEVFVFSKPLSGVHLVRDLSDERIVYRHGTYIAPRLCPDGEWVLFHSRQGGEMGVWLTDVDGEEMQRLCDGEQANWSPDGERIIFSRKGTIIEREIASGKEKTIVKEALPCSFPGYHPDGRVIFVSDGKIHLNDSDESLIRGDIRSAPRCSPDGKKIAYQDGAHIYLMDLDDGKIIQLTTAGGVQSWPMWSQDGLSICYCQSPEAFDGPWDICHLKIDSPQEVGIVTRDVEISPDWRGSRPLSYAAPELKGNGIAFDKGVEGEIAVENDWGVFYVSSEQNKILIFQKPADQKKMELVLINEEGEPATTIESIQVVRNDGEKVVLRVGLASEYINPMEAIFTIPRSRPFVEIKPVKNVAKVYVKKNIELALLPDRFADDLILDPREYSAERVLLPYAPFSIGLSAEDGMIMVITPSDDQETWLIKGEEDIFKGMEVLAAEEKVFVSLLSGKDVWHRTEVVSDPDTDGWKTKWSNPFLAQWRIAVAGKREHYSRMWDEEALSKTSKSSLPINRDFSESPELSIIYLYGRSWNTPLNVITPMDILQDALGIDTLKNVLDIEGLRTYRTAEKPVPLHTLLTSQGQRLWPEDCSGWPEDLDFSPFHPLIARIRMVERKGVESTAVHLCGDILNLLKGLDNRIEEYETFLVGLENLNVEHAASLFKMDESIQDLRNELTDLSITEIEEVSDAIEKVKGCMGSEKSLWGRDEFDEFWEISGSALSERQEVLAKYRDFVKKVRDEAGIIITKEPRIKSICEKIRGFAQDILRQKYYLEGGWRGEKPLD